MWITSLLLQFVLPSLVAQAPAEPVRMATRAFDSRVELEVRDLPSTDAEAAIHAAIAEIHQVQYLVDPERRVEGSLGWLNGHAGDGAQRVDPRLRAMLERGWHFCVWSRNAHGPLAGELYELWGLRKDRLTRHPRPSKVFESTRRAACNRLRINLNEGTVILEEESQLDLWGFASGYAVDRAVDVLRDHGVTNAWVEIGRVRRALGSGPEGRGWPVLLPVLPGTTEPLDEIYLQDRSLVTLMNDDFLFEVGDDAYPAFIDQRSGQPAQGVQGVLVVTDLAADAEPLAVSMLITGYREGQMRLGGLKPTPAVLWFLGSEQGSPLLASYHWSSLVTGVVPH